jgi:hypothetical protein
VCLHVQASSDRAGVDDNEEEEGPRFDVSLLESMDTNSAQPRLDDQTSPAAMAMKMMQIAESRGGSASPADYVAILEVWAAAIFCIAALR